MLTDDRVANMRRKSFRFLLVLVCLSVGLLHPPAAPGFNRQGVPLVGGVEQEKADIGEQEDEIQRLQHRVASDRNDATGWARLGDAYYKNKQYQLAVRAFQEAVRLKPEEARFRVDLGNALDDGGDPDGAIIQYLAAIRLEPKDPYSHRNVGVVYFRKGDRKAAEAAFREALRLKPDYWMARRSVVDVLVQKKDWKRIQHQYREALRLSRSEFLNHFGLRLLPVEQEELARASEEAVVHWCLGALFLNRVQDVKKARKEFERAARRDRNFALPHQVLAALYDMQGKGKQALDAAQEALRINGNLPNAYITVGNVHKREENLEKAVEAFQEAIRIAPDLAKAHFNLGGVYSDQREYEQAIEAYRKALVVGPKFDGRPQVHNNLAVAYFRTGLYSAAWKHVREAQRLGNSPHPGFLEALRKAAPESHELLSASRSPFEEDAGAFAIHFNGGVELMDEGKVVAAVRELRQALRLHPNHGRSREYLALVYAFSENLPRAWEQVRLMRMAGSEPPDTLLNLLNEEMPESEAVKELQRLEQEKAALEESIRREPENPETHVKLGDMLTKDLELDAAKQKYQIALSIDPEYVEAYLGLGTLYSGEEETFDQAVKHLRTYVDLAHAKGGPTEQLVSGWVGLASTFERAGREKEALETYEEALEKIPDNSILWNNAAWLYATAKQSALRDPAKALNYARKAIELAPEPNASWLDTLAEAYFINGLLDEAIDTEKKALALRPDDRFIQEQLKKFEEAKRKKKN